MGKISSGLVFLMIGLMVHVFTHAVQEIEIPQKEVISAYVNQAKTISIPFQKCFKVEPELDANLPYIDFRPTRIGLSSLKSYSIKNQGSHISTFEQLRSPNSFKHRNILVFDSYLIVFYAPNVIFIVQEMRDGFKIKNKYYLENLDRYDQFKMYKLQNRALIVIFNKKRVYLLNEVDYQDYDLGEISSIIHLQEVGQNMEFYAAESLKGLAHYRLNATSKSVELVERYTGENIGLAGKFNYIVDLNLRLLSNKNIIYALDAEIGLVEITKGNQTKSRVLVSHRNCESFDTIDEEHFVLLCQSQGHSTIIEAYRYLDKKTKEYKYRKIQPIFQANYLNDLHLAEEYYLVYSYKSLHAFWNTQKSRLPETLETQSEIAIPGLETFTPHYSSGLNYLYTIEAGELKKYELKQEKPKLALKSGAPIDKAFKIYLYGSCNDLSTQEPEESTKVKACKVSMNIAFKVIQEEYPHKQDLNISASIIIILITVFLLVIWVCLKKYKGLEREARKILESYQKKRSNKPRAI